MRNLIIYTITAGVFLIFTNCCHKRYCTGLNDQFMITLYNFNPGDVDSVAIETFQISSSGRMRLDSTFMFAQPYSYGINFTVNLSDALVQGQEYKITLTSKNMGSVYVLSDFTSKRESCNNCFPRGLMDDDFTALYSYMVNSQIQYYSDLRIVN